MHTPPGLDWFELIEYYAFRFVLLISFLWTLLQVLRHKLKGGALDLSTGRGARRRAVCEHVYMRAQPAATTETLSIRLNAQTKKRLDALAERSKRSKSFLAAEAIARYVESEEWQLGEIQDGISDLDQGRTVSHESVSKWLKSWGKPSEGKAPR